MSEKHVHVLGGRQVSCQEADCKHPVSTRWFLISVMGPDLGSVAFAVRGDTQLYQIHDHLKNAGATHIVTGREVNELSLQAWQELSSNRRIIRPEGA